MRQLPSFTWFLITSYCRSRITPLALSSESLLSSFNVARDNGMIRRTDEETRGTHPRGERRCELDSIVPYPLSRGVGAGVGEVEGAEMAVAVAKIDGIAGTNRAAAEEMEATR